ncbi:rhodanese-like domain-containing protein [Lewinella sp. IMCC34183]|uniref:rhodanese-like domain-containing protein n=1 Tax=Lewinella sp. IMCC34183 TaxID=2248762 RepID=UPI000E23A998|nr:rhodanese-like domain-containing protein [Lewinella sp. IMCC34183]
MTIQRFHDETTDQYSYLISEQGEAIAVDPSRRIGSYLEFLSDNELRLVSIVMTHTPGSFASGWAELREVTGADLYAASPLHFHGEGRFVKAGRATMIPFGDGSHLQTQQTPGFTEDSLSLLAIDKERKVHGIFTGGTLLNLGAGYPLPRPGDKNPLHGRRTYAKEEYGSIRNIITGFAPRATVFAGFGEDAHFAKMDDSTHERFNLTEAVQESPAMQPDTADRFADWLLKNAPFVPAYVAGCQINNREGYPHWAQALAPFRAFLSEEQRAELEPRHGVVDSQGGSVILTKEDSIAASSAPASAPNALPIGDEVLLIDTRNAKDFHAGHARNAINIQAEGPFALWLGAIVRPGEDFHVLFDRDDDAYRLAQAIAKIGYDPQVKGVTEWTGGLNEVSQPPLDIKKLKDDYVGKYTIVDVRPQEAAAEDTRFYGAINVPVWELRNRWKEIPQDRPIVVHCGGGYQSAIGASILRKHLPAEVVVHDLGEAIKKIKGA